MLGANYGADDLQATAIIAVACRLHEIQIRIVEYAPPRGATSKKMEETYLDLIYNTATAHLAIGEAETIPGIGTVSRPDLDTIEVVGLGGDRRLVMPHTGFAVNEGFDLEALAIEIQNHFN